MLKNIDLTNKCGSCCHFKPIEDTATGECLQNPYNDSVVHDPKHPHWIVQRSRIKCPLYNAKPLTNADLIRRMEDPELARYLYALANSDFELKFCQNRTECQALVDTDGGVPEENCMECLVEYLRQPVKEDDNEPG